MHRFVKGIAVTIVAIGFALIGNLKPSSADSSITPIGPVTVSTAPAGATFINGKTYGNISPRVIQLQHQSHAKDNGKLLITWEQEITTTQAAAGENPAFPIYESDDNGATWKHLTDVTEKHHEGWGKMNGPQLYELPQQIGDMPAGTVVLAGNACPNDLSATDLELEKSTDAGKTWQFESSIATGGASVLYGDPIWEPFLMVHNNKLICYYSDERDNYVARSQDIVHQTTTDGSDWSNVIQDTHFSTPASGDTSAVSDRPGMPVVAQLSNGNWAMSYEAHGGSSTGVRISPDPEKWDVNDRGHQMADRSGGPFIVTLNNGSIAFNASMYNGDGRVYVFDTENQITADRGIGGAARSFQTQTGTAYFRDLVPLGNGMLLVANGGKPQPSKSNSIRVETVNVGDSAKQGAVTVHYVDQNGNAIRTNEVIKGTVGDSYDVSTLVNSTVSGYQYQGVTTGQDNVTGNFGADNIEITVTYSATNSNNGGGTNAIPATNSSTTGQSTSGSTNSNESAKETSASNATATKNGVKKVTPFLIQAKRAFYQYDAATFSKKARQQKVSKGTTLKVIATTKSNNCVARYKLSNGHYITANGRYVTKKYYTTNFKKLYVTSKHGIYEYKKVTLSKANRIKLVKKGGVLKVKKMIHHGLTTRYQLMDGHFVTGNKMMVSLHP